MRLNGISSALLLKVGMIGLFTQAASTPGWSEPSMSGPPDAVRLIADQDKVKDALDALERGYKLQFRSFVDLDELISGTYEGPLSQVIARLLEHYDYITKTTDGTVQITIYRSNRASRPTTTGVLSPSVAATLKPAAEEARTAAKKSPLGPAVPGPVVAPWPPLPPPTQDPVAAQLDLTMRMQIPPQGNAPASSGTTSVDPNAVPNIAQMTRNASTALDGLKAALDRLPH